MAKNYQLGKSLASPALTPNLTGWARESVATLATDGRRALTAVNGPSAVGTSAVGRPISESERAQPLAHSLPPRSLSLVLILSLSLVL